MRNLRNVLTSSIAAFLLPLPAFAASINPDDAPIFWSILGQKETYHDAAFKAQQAFFIQTGFTATYNKLNGYISGKATNAVNNFVDDNLPISSKTLAFAVGTVYAVGIKKQVSKSFKNPIWPSVTHDVTVSPTEGSFGINIPFPR